LIVSRVVTEIPSFFSYYNVLFLLQGAASTLGLSVIGCCFGTLIALGIVLIRVSRRALVQPVRWLAIFYTEVFRRVPFLVTLMLVFFAFQLSGADVSLFVIGAVSVTLIASAFMAEIVRAGFESVHRNQWDAAASMNFGLIAEIRYIILPQAWPVILPPAFGFFVLFIKDTALASQIGVIELTYVGKVLNNKGFSAALVFGTVLIAYFFLSYPLTRLSARLEKYLAASRHRRH
jgi:polar amino acid transport system permease protein